MSVGMSTMQGKVAIVTGGGGSIGRAILDRLHDAGCHLACFDSDAEKLRSVAGQFSDGTLMTRQLDLTDEPASQAAFDEVVARFGKVDFLVNAVGRVGPSTAVAEACIDDFDALFASNVRAGYIAMKIALRHMRARGEGGAIVNLSSTAASKVRPGRSLYAMTKRAVEAMTIAAALENVDHHIRVNAVAPGPIESEMYNAMAGQDGKAGQGASSATATGILGQPQDVAALVAFLLGDDARHCTGHVYFVDAGAAA